MYQLDQFGMQRQLELYRGLGRLMPVSYEDWERQARQILADGPFDYIAGGTGFEYTMQANREAFERWRILPRMLVDVSERSMRVRLLDQSLPAPILLAPVGIQREYHPEGELATARAAAELRLPFVVSAVSSYPMEAIAQVMNGAPRWFQLYEARDPEITASFVRRAEAAGYSAIILTHDRPTRGWRERDLRNTYLPYMRLEGMGNYLTDPVFRAGLKRPPEADPEAAFQHFWEIFYNPKVVWSYLDELRRMTRLPVWVKGVLDPRDAELALEHGAQGIMVSNHGGRHIDGGVATLDALPDIVSTVAGKVPVVVDSGIRRGSDVVKALALGAAAVMVGRLYIYGLVVAGSTGVTRTVRNLMADLDLTMANAGRRTVDELDRTLLVKVR